MLTVRASMIPRLIVPFLPITCNLNNIKPSNAFCFQSTTTDSYSVPDSQLSSVPDGSSCKNDYIRIDMKSSLPQDMDTDKNLSLQYMHEKHAQNDFVRSDTYEQNTRHELFSLSIDPVSGYPLTED